MDSERVLRVSTCLHISVTHSKTRSSLYLLDQHRKLSILERDGWGKEATGSTFYYVYYWIIVPTNAVLQADWSLEKLFLAM